MLFFCLSNHLDTSYELHARLKKENKRPCNAIRCNLLRLSRQFQDFLNATFDEFCGILQRWKQLKFKSKVMRQKCAYQCQQLIVKPDLHFQCHSDKLRTFCCHSCVCWRREWNEFASCWLTFMTCENELRLELHSAETSFSGGSELNN